MPTQRGHLFDIFFGGMLCLFLWLRSPNADNAYNARYVDRDGNDNNANTYHGIIGVRPASVI